MKNLWNSVWEFIQLISLLTGFFVIAILGALFVLAMVVIFSPVWIVLMLFITLIGPVRLAEAISQAKTASPDKENQP